ncbi:MAG: hypothetical protein TREMPRED_005847, partial [Tremellales sp. Tagirdzhanova-0007]
MPIPPRPSETSAQSTSTGLGPVRPPQGGPSRPRPYAPSFPHTLDEHPASSRSLSRQPSQSREARSIALLDNRNEPYWVKTGKDWGNDSTPSSPCSTELILRWLELPDNWAFFHDGKGGGTQVRGAKQVSAWLKQKKCPSERSPAAFTRKLNGFFDKWKKAKDYEDGTGNGQGARRIMNAEPGTEQEVIDDVKTECNRICPYYDRLTAVFTESDGGTVNYRGDTLHDTNAVLDLFSLPLHDVASQYFDDQEDEEDDEDDEDAEIAEPRARRPRTSGTSRRGGRSSISDALDGGISRGDKALRESNAALIQKEERYRDEKSKRQQEDRDSQKVYREEKKKRFQEDRDSEKENRAAQLNSKREKLDGEKSDRRERLDDDRKGRRAQAILTITEQFINRLGM